MYRDYEISFKDYVEKDTKIMAELKEMKAPAPDRIARFNGTCGICGEPIIANVSRIFVERKGESSGVQHHFECFGKKPGEKREELKDVKFDGNLKPIQDSINIINRSIRDLKAADDKHDASLKDVEASIKKLTKELKDYSNRLPRESKIQVAELPPITFKHAHKELPKVIKYAANRKHVYLYGDKGGGKSTAAKQAAEALGLPYEYISLDPMSPASLVMGYMTPDGRYIESGFYRCYANGGVYCVDEFDNASPSTLTLLNGALANGLASFPCGPVPMHKDFIFIATGNTDGRGATFAYPERKKIGEATMDRVVHINWFYDEELESNIALTLNPKAGDWIDYVRKVRKFVNDPNNGIREGIYATPRTIIEGATDLLMGIPPAEIAEGRIFRGVTKAVQDKIIKAVGKP